MTTTSTPSGTLSFRQRIQGQLHVGKGILAIAKDVGVGSGTVQRIKRESAL